MSRLVLAASAVAVDFERIAEVRPLRCRRLRG
mgnify:CR=1 FL=1